MNDADSRADESAFQLAEALSRRLEQLEILEKPIAIEPLSGGMTNHNFLVRSATGRYVARVCQPLPHLGIDRRNEAVCHEIAAALGIAPALVHRDDDLLISRWIDGRSLAAADLRDGRQRSRVIALLQCLQMAWDTLEGEILYFSPFQTIRTYARTAAALGAGLPKDLPSTLEDMRLRSRAIAPFFPVLCHNDLLAANLIDDGVRLWLVDWEFGGIGHPLFDLANLAANASFSDEEGQDLLDTYTNNQTTNVQLADFRLLKAASLLREALWGSIQTVTASIDFDYSSYAAEHYAAYLQARAGLDSC
jgi:thiamine kinase-like enzyme